MLEVVLGEAQPSAHAEQMEVVVALARARLLQQPVGLVGTAEAPQAEREDGGPADGEDAVGRERERPAVPQHDVLVAQAPQGVVCDAVRDHGREQRVRLGVAALPRLGEQLAGLLDAAVERRQLADDAVAARALREAGHFAGVGARLRGVAGGEHPVDGAQQPLLALRAAGAEAGGGHHRHGGRLHALAGGLALRELLEPVRQVCVRARCRGGEMPQRRALVLDQVGGERVQVGAPARPDLVIDGGGDERMGERRGRDGRGVDPAQQARVARLLERVERLLDPAQRGGDRERGAWSEDRPTASSSRAASSEQASTRRRTIAANERGAGRLSCRCQASAGSSSRSARV